MTEHAQVITKKQSVWKRWGEKARDILLTFAGFILLLLIIVAGLLFWLAPYIATLGGPLVVAIAMYAMTRSSTLSIVLAVILARVADPLWEKYVQKNFEKLMDVCLGFSDPYRDEY